MGRPRFSRGDASACVGIMCRCGRRASEWAGAIFLLKLRKDLLKLRDGADAAVLRIAVADEVALPFGRRGRKFEDMKFRVSAIKGGEIVPTMFIGAVLGCTVGPLLGIPAQFASAIALVAVFCGAVNCPIASIILSVELFGSGELLYFALACGISYMLSGYFGLYSSQKIMYSKTRAEFINRYAK